VIRGHLYGTSIYRNLSPVYITSSVSRRLFLSYKPRAQDTLYILLLPSRLRPLHNNTKKKVVKILAEIERNQSPTTVCCAIARVQSIVKELEEKREGSEALEGLHLIDTGESSPLLRAPLYTLSS
jgi:hypothetical protein